MQNEERILTILEQVQGDIGEIKEDVSGLKQDMTEVKQDVSALKERTTHIEVTLENVTNRNIQLMMENQTDFSRRLDAMKGSIDEMAPTVTAVDVLHQMQGLAKES